MLKELVNDINKELGIDILVKNRARKYVAGRMFLYYYAYKKLNLSSYKMSIQLKKEFDFHIDRGSVRFAVVKAEHDLTKETVTMGLVKANFPELLEKKKEEKALRLSTSESNKKELIYTNNNCEKLIDLVKDLTYEQLKDVENMVELRVKSYSWKTKDKCEIIEGYEQLNCY